MKSLGQVSVTVTRVLSFAAGTSSAAMLSGPPGATVTIPGSTLIKYLRRIDPGAHCLTMNRLVKISLLLFFFALCGAAILATHFARERTAPPATKELYSLVNRQLSAFRAADFDSAYRHAAAGVQQKFSRSQFELMIRRDFSPMTEAEHVEFGVVRVAGAAALGAGLPHCP